MKIDIYTNIVAKQFGKKLFLKYFKKLTSKIVLEKKLQNFSNKFLYLNNF